LRGTAAGGFSSEGQHGDRIVRHGEEEQAARGADRIRLGPSCAGRCTSMTTYLTLSYAIPP
jgi:hypothetical protein